MNLETGVLLKQLHRFEIDFITGNLNNHDYSINLAQLQPSILIQDLNILIKHIVNHEYSEILSLNLECFKPLKDFLNNCTPEFYEKDGENKSNFQHLFEPSDNYPYVKEVTFLLIGVAALQEFVRANMCGPHVPGSTVYPICSNLLPDERFSHDRILEALGKNGETIITKVSHPKLLYLSLLLFFSNVSDNCLTHKWWLLRCLLIQQLFLPESVPELHRSIMYLIKKQGEMKFLNNKECPLAEIMFYIECAQAHLHYHEINLAEKFITKAQQILELSIELSGAVGKRTRFQSKAVAQLLVKTKRNIGLYQTSLVLSGSSFPSDLVLQDDTLLHNIELVDGESNKVEEMLPEEQIILLAHCCLVKKRRASTELKQEEVMSYINFLLSQPKMWSLHAKALTMRCQAEKDATRKFERSLTQMEEIINCVKKQTPPFSERQIMLYCVAFPLNYNLEKSLADMLMHMGSVKSALEIYERLHLWEDAILCYKYLGMTHKAVKILQELIAKRPTPLLWCYLGDVTENPENYQIAWDLSKHQSARSQRSLGYYYFQKKDYKSSITHFNLAVAVNHLQPTVWFSLGYAATECEDYDLAARAYRQVVLLDDDNFEAWNNLSNAYIKTKQKDRAWRSLQEALKCNYEEWRVWENFLLVSVDIGSFEDVIRAFHRLLDLKGKHVDTEVLGILVAAIDKDMPDFHDSPSFRLKDKTLQLFGRLTSITTNNPMLWQLYSILQCSGSDFKKEKEVLERALTFQNKAVRSYIRDSSWETEIEAFKFALKACIRFSELCVAFVQLLEDTNQRLRHKTSAKYSLTHIVTRADKACFAEEEFPHDTLIAAKAALLNVCNL